MAKHKLPRREAAQQGLCFRQFGAFIMLTWPHGLINPSWLGGFINPCLGGVINPYRGLYIYIYIYGCKTYI